MDSPLRARDVFSRDEMRALTRRSDLAGFFAVGSTWAIIAATFAALARWPHPLTFAAAVVVLGGRQLALSILMHEAAHRTLFERRVLTYTDTNPDPYKVEMGNIGQHYYHWRYASTAPVPATGNAPTTGSTAPPATDQMDPFGPAAPLTRMYTDPQGLFALHYPAGWHVTRRASVTGLQRAIRAECSRLARI